jgi:hypothetical protein
MTSDQSSWVNRSNPIWLSGGSFIKKYKDWETLPDEPHAVDFVFILFLGKVVGTRGRILKLNSFPELMCNGRLKLACLFAQD